MAAELQIAGSMAFSKASPVIASVGCSFGSQSVTVTGNNFIKKTQTIGYENAEALILGDVVPGGYAYFKNIGSTNYIKLMTGTAGAVFARLKPGEWAIFRLDASVTAPAAQADTADTPLEYMLLED
jgi:hypothetical protein